MTDATYKELMRNLAERFPLHHSEADRTELPRILDPIDRGAKELLLPYREAALAFPPTHVEYLIRTLNEHLENCLEIRRQAQELEVRAFSEAIVHVLEADLLKLVEEQNELLTQNEPFLLGNLYNAVLESDPAGSSSYKGETTDYWEKLKDNLEQQVDLKKQAAEQRIAQLGQEGVGSNFVERFEFLRKLFNVDLVEAYRRFQAIVVGIKHVYNLDVELPSPSDVGYLNKLVLSAREVTYLLERRLLERGSSTVAFTLHTTSVTTLPAPLTHTEFRTARDSGNILFEIKEDFFDQQTIKLKNPRIRAVEVFPFVNHSPPGWTAYWRVRLELPEQEIDTLGAQPTWKFTPSLNLSMTTFPQRSTIGEIKNQREVFNTSPFGEWKISLDSHSLSGSVGTKNNGHFDNLVIRLHLTHEL